MHFVKKGESPKFFEDNKEWYVENDPSWGNLDVTSDLRSHLITEQDQLCIYCECDITEIKSHIEHIFPRSKHPQLTFEYQNLVASCDGGKGPSHSCGQKKDNDFDPNLFLNPVSQNDIEDYFSYDVDSGVIEESEKNEERANYTIGLLGLNNPRLNGARKNAVNALTNVIRNHPNRKAVLQKIFEKKNRPFISILRFRYRNIL